MSASGSLDQDYKRDRSRSPMDRKPVMNKSSRSRKNTRRVAVSNIPYEYKWQELKDLFRQEVGEVSYVELFKDDNGRPRGAGVIEFANEETAQKAIEKMHRYEIGDRSIIVKEDLGESTRNKDRGSNSGGSSRFTGNIMQNRMSDMSGMANMNAMGNMNNMGGMSAMNNMGMGMNNMSANTGTTNTVNYGNTYGLSIPFLESLGINGQLVNRVFVANLDYSIDEEKLMEVFKIAGKVKNVDLSKDPETSKSRGFGVVEFDHPVEAVQAISMLHGQWYYERKLSVRMDRVHDNRKADKPAATKLPAGLKGLGQGLGSHGSPLTDFSNLSSSSFANMQPSTNNLPMQNMGMGQSNMMSGMNNMSSMSNMNQMGNMGGMGMGGNDMSAMSGMMGNNAAGMPNNTMMAAMAQQLGNAATRLNTGNTGNNRGYSSGGNSRFSR